MLFRQDEVHWVNNLEITKREANNIKEELRAFLEEQNQKLAALINRSIKFSAKPKFSLRKLPFWGQECSN